MAIASCEIVIEICSGHNVSSVPPRTITRDFAIVIHSLLANSENNIQQICSYSEKKTNGEVYL